MVVIPARETSPCTKDEDCAVTELGLEGPAACCFLCCHITAGTKDWVSRVHEACKARPGCVATACRCPMPPHRPRCREGVCVAEY